MRKSGAIQRQLSGIRVKATRVAVLVDVIEFDLFYDYTCPFVYRAAEMLDLVTSTRQRELRITWRYFSLAQVNAKDPAWSIWDASDQERVRGRLAFKAAEAARKQGGFDRLHMRSEEHTSELQSP